MGRATGVDVCGGEGVKRLVVTGASGLLGQSLVKRFEKSGEYEVVGVSRSDLDLTVEAQVRQLGRVKPDCVVHAGGYGQPVKFMSEPRETVVVNTESVRWLIELLGGKGKFLFVSSAHAGLEVDPTHPRAGYVVGKKLGEVVTWQGRASGVECKVVRPALLYGPGCKIWDRRVMSDFISRGLTSSIHVHGDGRKRSCYCFVDDASEMIFNVFERGKRFCYNIGGRDWVSVGELAGVIGEKMGKEVVFVPGEIAPGAPMDEGVDIREYEEEFGKVVFTPFSEGIDRTIEYTRRLHELEVARRGD